MRPPDAISPGRSRFTVAAMIGLLVAGIGLYRTSRSAKTPSSSSARRCISTLPGHGA